MRRKGFFSAALWVQTHHQEKAVERILEAHSTIARQAAPPDAGYRWHSESREALLNAGVVLLVSYLQAYVEAVFKEAAERAYPAVSKPDLNGIVKGATRQFHNPSPSNIDRLFLSVGAPRVTYGASWQRWPNQRVRKALKDLVDARHRIAHGTQTKDSWRHFSTTKKELQQWHRLVVRFHDYLATKFCRA